MALTGATASVIAAYLTWTKLAGALPACGPLEGCEQVATSTYAEFLGIPVALLGLVGSLLTLGAALAWWRRRSEFALWIAYGLGLASLPVLLWLTYLELFVIGAVCVWCVAYAMAVVIGWLASLLVLKGSTP